MKQAAVGIVALELGLERCREIKRLGSSGQSRLNVVGLLSHGKGCDGLQLLPILVLDLLPVFVHEGLLLHIAIVIDGPRGLLCREFAHLVVEVCRVAARSVDLVVVRIAGGAGG